MKIDARLIGYITVLENLTRARVKDVFLDKNGNLVFIVGEGDGGKAIGRHGRNIKMMSGMLKKRIKIIEYDSDVGVFIGNLISPLKAELVIDNGIVVLKSKDVQTKAKLIGRNRENLKALNNVVKRFFDVEVKVF